MNLRGVAERDGVEGGNDRGGGGRGADGSEEKLWVPSKV